MTPNEEEDGEHPTFLLISNTKPVEVDVLPIINEIISEELHDTENSNSIIHHQHHKNPYGVSDVEYSISLDKKIKLKEVKNADDSTIPDEKLDPLEVIRESSEVAKYPTVPVVHNINLEEEKHDEISALPMLDLKCEKADKHDLVSLIVEKINENLNETEHPSPIMYDIDPVIEDAGHPMPSSLVHKIKSTEVVDIVCDAFLNELNPEPKEITNNEYAASPIISNSKPEEETDRECGTSSNINDKKTEEVIDSECVAASNVNNKNNECGGTSVVHNTKLDEVVDKKKDEEEYSPYRKMQDRDYYSYYKEFQTKEYYTMYPEGKTTLPMGAILHFSKVTDTMRREDIYHALASLGANIAFIEFQMGHKEGWVRLTEENAALKIIQKMTNNTIKIAETDVVFRVLSGNQEMKYLKKAADAIFERRRHFKSLNRLLKKRSYKYLSKFNN